MATNPVLAPIPRAKPPASNAKPVAATRQGDVELDPIATTDTGPSRRTSVRTDAAATPHVVAVDHAAYGAGFWLCYLANAAISVAVSLLYRYADFVHALAGDDFELELGWITGVGMVGSLAMRWWLGTSIDRLGPRRVWLASLALFALVCVAHALVTTAHGPAVYALRILYCMSIAGTFGSSITYVSHTVPPWRMAEVVGTLGTSGFVGMAIGPMLGDWILGGATNDVAALNTMFFVASAMALVALATAAIGTRANLAPAHGRHDLSTLSLVRRYQPGALLAVGVAIGLGLGFPGTFLRAYTHELAIEQLQLFFLVYTITGFVARVASRRLASSMGVRPLLLWGMGFLVSGVLAYLVVDSYAMLILPAILTGVAHALLFPALVAAGGMAFPERHRGLATTLMLASMDIGVLVGSPFVGWTIEAAKRCDLPAYPTMFVAVAIALALPTIVYATRPGSSPGSDAECS